MTPTFRNRWIRAGTALIGLILGLLGLVPGATNARAEEAEPTLEVLGVGWDGQITQGTWAPVRVKLSGGSRDLEGLVEVTLEDKYQPDQAITVRVPHAAYAQEISLPANTAKEVTVWVPTTRGLFGTVRLREAGGGAGQELAAQEIEFRVTKAPYWPLVGVLAAEESLVTAVGKVELPLQNLPTQIHVAGLRADALPLHADRLRGLRGIVVQGNAPAHLSDGQRQAVLDWVRNGGHLLLAGGPDSALTVGVLPEGALPVRFGGAELNLDLAPLLRWIGGSVPAQGLTGPAVRMEPTGGTILAGSTERPLAWRTNLGQGSVTVLAADPTLEPLASQPQLTLLLKRALGGALFDENLTEEQLWRLSNANQDQMYYQIRGALDSLPAGAYPNWKQVALFLGAFGLLVGPVLHLLLWRGRRGWVWLAVPAASLLVAGGIYLVSITLGGRDLLGHTLSHLQIDQESGTASQAVMVGLYSPMHREMTLTMDGEAAANATIMMEDRGWGNWIEDPPKTAPFRIVTGREVRLELLRGEAAMRPVSFRRSLQSEAGRITSHLTPEGDLIKGRVTNETPYLLDQAWVVIGRTAQPLGPLPPGESVDVLLEPSGRIDPFRHMPVSHIFLGEEPDDEEMRRRMGLPPDAPIPPGMDYYLEVPRDSETLRRAQLLDSLLQVYGRGGETPFFPLTLVAFTQERVGADMIDLKGHPSHYLTLVEQRLQLDLGSGEFRLPPALLPPEISLYGGWGGGSNGTITWMELHGNTTTFEYRPPLLPGARVTALEVTTQQLGDSILLEQNWNQPMPLTDKFQGAELGIFQIFNWQTNTWEPLPGGQERVRLSNPAPYLGAEGQVRIQVGAANRVVRFALPELSVEGRGGQ